jgi:hypothetical protein
MPIVRGETGLDTLDLQEENTDLIRDLNGVWLHNMLWSSLGPGAVSELYWWKETLDSSPGPDGQPGLFEVYRYFEDFMNGIPLNNGNYVDTKAVLSDPDLMVIGQKDTTNQRAHLWVWNRNFTWRNVVDGMRNFTGLSGTVTMDGFMPNISLPVTWYKFKAEGIPVIASTQTATDSRGNLVLNLPADTSLTDVAIKVGEYAAPPMPDLRSPLRRDDPWRR